MHRFPTKADHLRRQQWLIALGLKEEQLQDHHRICSRHFPNGDVSQVPSLHLGKRFASPKKMKTPRGLRATKRKSLFPEPTPKRHLKSVSPSSSASRPVTPTTSDATDGESSDLIVGTRLTTPIGEVYLSDYSIHELPSEESCLDLSSGSNLDKGGEQSSEAQVVVNTALVARIEALEAQTRSLRFKLSKTQPSHFRLENIAHSDSLIAFYTGFQTYDLFLAFYEFLGPSVNKLTYWGTKNESGNRRKMKLNPLNQLLMTLMKLKLNLRERDLAYRFGVSVSVVSKYFITWVCFLYSHLREIDWMPTVEQVKGTLPCAFQEKYPRTYIIIDASEVFMETPTDLRLQSSTWSNYKHHNTVKFLVGCTPNGAVSFVSELYMGSISDVQLTSVSGLLDKLGGKQNISVMADRGFTIRDQLKTIGADLNIPPFMEGRGKLPASEVLEGRRIASVRIHVERVIGRIKNYSILKGTLPITLSRMANQIVCVCAWLVNFQTVLVPPTLVEETDSVEEYFDTYYDTQSDYDADTELSDDD